MRAGRANEDRGGREFRVQGSGFRFWVRGMMRKSIILAACLFAGSVLAPATDVSAVELQPVAGGAPFRFGWQLVATGTAAPKTLIKQPALKSSSPLYLSIPLGSVASAITCVIDESKGTETGYDTLCVDANNNGDLTDDPLVQPRVNRSDVMTLLETEPMSVKVKYQDGGQRTLIVRLEMRGYPKAGSREMSWSASCSLDQHLEGRLAIGSRTNVLIGIYDSSRENSGNNGCFNDFGVDRFRIDLNGDGKLDEETEDFPLSRVLVLDGRQWKVEADNAARRFEVAPSGLPAGKVRVAFNFAADAVIESGMVELISADGFAFGCSLPMREPAVIPEAVYCATNARMSLVDGKGRKWGTAFSVSKPVAVSRGKEACITCGAPLRVEPKIIGGQLKRGGQVCVGFGLTGGGSEAYEDIAPEKTRMAPFTRIIGAEDVVVSEGNMEYG